MIKVFAGLLLAMVFVPSAYAQVILDQTNIEGAHLTFDEVHRMVSTDFLDPRSAQYKQLSVVTRYDGKEYICGWVNAKNAQGGYTAFSPFYVDVLKGVAELGDGYDDKLIGLLVVSTFQMVGCAKPLELEMPKQ